MTTDVLSHPNCLYGQSESNQDVITAAHALTLYLQFVLFDLAVQRPF